MTIYAWIPVLVFDLDTSIPRVATWDPKTGRTAINYENCVRLSPWDSETHKRITKIYEDLAKHVSLKGILFHDGAFLMGFEDASPGTLATYRAAGLPSSIEQVRNNPQTFERWTRLRSKMLIGFIKQPTLTVRNIRGPQIQTTRNIYVISVLEPENEAWFAQDLNDFSNTYDWTAPMVMPFMEQIPVSGVNARLDQLVNAVA